VISCSKFGRLRPVEATRAIKSRQAKRELTVLANVSRKAELEESLAKTSARVRGKKDKPAALNRDSDKRTRSNEAASAASGIRALLDSTIFRNVVAAGLAAAAAALVSRGSGPSNDLTQPTPARDDPHRGDAQAKSPTPTSKVRRKAKSASAAVADAAESVSLGKAGAKVARKATKTAKAAKAALAASDQDSRTARNDQSIGAAPQQRTRKVRSDAGIQRQRPRVPAATPAATSTKDLPVLAQTETSALALDAATTSVDDVAAQSSEELAAGAHPS
jgi:hypothetical protein